MINKSLFALIFCLLITLPSIADPYTGAGDGYSGGYAKYTRLDGYYSGQGGEFTLYGYGLTLSNSAYSSDTSGLLVGYTGSFQTFCLEKSEVAGKANIWVSEAFVDGTPGSHAYKGGNDDENNGLGDDLDPRTAFLYYQFATGSLDGYDYDEEDDRDYSAGQLQKAIWYIEDEINWLWSGNALAWEWINMAQNAIDTQEWVGIGNVRVLQMYNYTQTCFGCNIDYRQDFLYVESAPVPAAAFLGVLGMAIAGIKLRKFA